MKNPRTMALAVAQARMSRIVVAFLTRLARRCSIAPRAHLPWPPRRPHGARPGDLGVPSLPLEPCAEIPPDGCPVQSGGTCADPTCAALYAVHDRDLGQLQACPQHETEAAVAEGAAPAAGRCSTPARARPGHRHGSGRGHLAGLHRRPGGPRLPHRGRGALRPEAASPAAPTSSSARATWRRAAPSPMLGRRRLLRRQRQLHRHAVTPATGHAGAPPSATVPIDTSPRPANPSPVGVTPRSCSLAPVSEALLNLYRALGVPPSAVPPHLRPRVTGPPPGAALA